MREQPSLAIEFLLGTELQGSRCSLVPGLFSVRHRNSLWQEAVVGGATLLLYSAHYDDRDPSGEWREGMRVALVTGTPAVSGRRV